MIVLIKSAIHTLSQKEKIQFSELSEENYPLSNIANFINCYLSQLYVAKNYPFYLWHYFNLLNFLANLNLECAYYLLSKKIIARFYGFFFDKQLDKNFPEYLDEQLKLKDMSDCPYRKLAINEIKTGGFQSKYLQKKRAVSGKNDAVYSISHMNLEFFWKTIADLMNYCRFSSDSSAGQQLYQLSELETMFLKNEKPKFLMNIWESADNMKAAKSIAKIYAFACKEDENFSLVLIRFYCSKIFIFPNENTIKYMLKGLYFYMNIEDSLTKSRVCFWGFVRF